MLGTRAHSWFKVIEDDKCSWAAGSPVLVLVTPAMSRSKCWFGWKWNCQKIIKKKKKGGGREKDEFLAGWNAGMTQCSVPSGPLGLTRHKGGPLLFWPWNIKLWSDRDSLDLHRDHGKETIFWWRNKKKMRYWRRRTGLMSSIVELWFLPSEMQGEGYLLAMRHAFNEKNNYFKCWAVPN